MHFVYGFYSRNKYTEKVTKEQITRKNVMLIISLKVSQYFCTNLKSELFCRKKWIIVISFKDNPVINVDNVINYR